jgi:hypothetical protein
MITNSLTNSKTKQILLGVNILLNYCADAKFGALEGQIFFGKRSQGKQEIEVSEKDKVLLEQLGWFFDKEFEEWSIFE